MQSFVCAAYIAMLKRRRLVEPQKANHIVCWKQMKQFSHILLGKFVLITAQ